MGLNIQKNMPLHVLLERHQVGIHLFKFELSDLHCLGYVGHDAGGQLTEYVRRKPYCIILIDEIEKASREFVTLFLQVLDDGRLTDGQGRVVDFRNSVIIMTSNLGAAYLNDMGQGPVKSQTRALVMGAIQMQFPPEFINRIDEIIIFVSHWLFPRHDLKID
jgi:ATP-dependent Clp protease ATP-binding subunit ClpA